MSTFLELLNRNHYPPDQPLPVSATPHRLFYPAPALEATRRHATLQFALNNQAPTVTPSPPPLQSQAPPQPPPPPSSQPPPPRRGGRGGRPRKNQTLTRDEQAQLSNVVVTATTTTTTIQPPPAKRGRSSGTGAGRPRSNQIRNQTYDRSFFTPVSTSEDANSRPTTTRSGRTTKPTTAIAEQPLDTSEDSDSLPDDDNNNNNTGNVIPQPIKSTTTTAELFDD